MNMDKKEEVIANAGKELAKDELEKIAGGNGNGYIFDGNIDEYYETFPGSGLYTDGNGNYVSPIVKPNNNK